MYESHFGLKEKPFNLAPDPDFLYLSKQHSTAYSMLEYGLFSKAPLIVITGEIGSGKTTLLRHLLNQADADSVIGLISNTHESLGGLMEWVMVAFGIDDDLPSDAARFKRFTEFLIEQYGKGLRTVLIVDEAQNMPPSTLEELRLLTNINADKHEVLQLVLVGQPELRDSLKRPELKQFLQRVSVAYHLGELSEPDTANYIRHRLSHAGAAKDIFTDDAMQAVYSYTKGVPRLTNIVCDTALVYGFAAQTTQVDRSIVQEVIADRESTGLFSELNK